MGKKLFLFAAAAIALASCTETDLSGDTSFAKESTSDAIQFSAKAGNAGTTRAGKVDQINTASLKTGTHASDGFAVFAFNTGTDGWETAKASATPNFMYNQQVTWNSTNNAWEYSPVKYWPNATDAANATNSPSNTATQANAQKLSFFAYAPYVPVTVNSGTPTGDATWGIKALTANNATGDPTITYSLKRTGTDPSYEYDLSAASNVDLLWGVKGKNSYSEASESDNVQTLTGDYNTDLTKFNTTDRIAFNLKHALSKFGGYDNGALLKVVADIDDNSTTPTTTGTGNLDGTTLITLKEITIKPKNDADDANKIIMNGNFDITTGVWSRLSSGDIVAPTTHNLLRTNYKTGDAQTTGVNTEVWEPASAPTYTASTWSPIGVSTSLKDVYSSASTGAGAFYLIPFTKDKNGSAFTYNPQIEVTVTYIVRTYDDHLASPGTGETTCSKVEQTITNYVTLPQIATNKVYTLVMHLGLTSVKFSAEVADWESQTNTEDNIEVVWLPSNVVELTQEVNNLSAAQGSTSVNLTGLAANTTLTVVSVDNTVVAQTSDVTNLTTNESGAATVNIAYSVNNDTENGRQGKVVLSDGFKKITITLNQNAATAP